MLTCDINFITYQTQKLRLQRVMVKAAWKLDLSAIFSVINYWKDIWVCWVNYLVLMRNYFSSWWLCVLLDSIWVFVVEASFELSLQTSFLFSCGLPPTARYTWLNNNIPVNQCQIFRASSVVSLFGWFFDHILFFVFLSCIPTYTL